MKSHQKREISGREVENRVLNCLKRCKYFKVGRVCPQRAGPRMQNGSGALGTDAPYHYWVQGFDARIFRGILSLRERAGVRGNKASIRN